MKEETCEMRCPSCNGTGISYGCSTQYKDSYECPNCRGTGKVKYYIRILDVYEEEE